MILSSASDAFDKMFYGEFEKPSIEKPLVVEIPDGTPDAFHVLLEYVASLFRELGKTFRSVYTDKATLTIDNVNSVLYLSKKYLLTDLTNRAVQYLKNQMNASNAIKYLPMSELFGELQTK